MVAASLCDDFIIFGSLTGWFRSFWNFDVVVWCVHDGYWAFNFLVGVSLPLPTYAECWWIPVAISPDLDKWLCSNLVLAGCCSAKAHPKRTQGDLWISIATLDWAWVGASNRNNQLKTIKLPYRCTSICSHMRLNMTTALTVPFHSLFEPCHTQLKPEKTRKQVSFSKLIHT